MRPPRLAARIVRLLAGRDDAPYVLGDLAEEFELITRDHGPAAARRWYWRQVLTSITPLAVSGVRRFRQLAGMHVRDSFRVLRRAPGMSLLIVTTLALGIGANTAVFSVVDAVLLRPLPFSEPDRLVALWEHEPDRTRITVSGANLADYEALDQTFTGLAAFSTTSVTARVPRGVDQFQGEGEDWRLWPLLGVRPALGRPFAEHDAEPGAEPVAIVSHAFWHDELGSDPDVLGRSLSVNNQSRTIVGVMPEGHRALVEFSTRTPISIYVPMRAAGVGSRGDHQWQVVGRLRDGVTVEQAQTALDRVSSGLAQQFPESNRNLRTAVSPLANDLTRRVRTSLLLVFGAVGTIVLIACVNMANLLLVWATSQRRSVAVRLALGATRADIVTEHAIRGCLFAVAGGGAGIVLGVWIRNILVALAPPSVIPNTGQLSLNPRVLAFAIVLSLLTCLAASIVPALQVIRRCLSPTMHESALAVVGTRSVLRWRGALLMAEVAAAVVLALGAGLLVRSLVMVDRVELGFTTNRVVTMTVQLPAAGYPNADASLRFFERLQERVAAMPGVDSVAYANQFPMRGGWGGAIVIETPAGLQKGEAELQAVSPEYFTTLGIPLRHGRMFDDGDVSGSEPVVVVSQTFADRYFGQEDPVGRIVRRNVTAPALRIIGVAGEVRRDGKFGSVEPQLYFSSRQTSLYAVRLAALAVRASANPLALVPAVRQAVEALDPRPVVSGVLTLDEVIDSSLATRRFHSSVLSLFAVLALVLALVGVYGVVNYVVSQRDREIGLRAALGATPAQLVMGVMRSGLTWAAAGIVLGAAIAAATSSVLSALLFDTTAQDPLTFAGVTLAVAAVAALAAYVPASRATRSDPIAALRGDS